MNIYLCDDDAASRHQIQAILERKICMENYDMRIVCNVASPEQLLEALEELGEVGGIGAMGEGKSNIYFLDVDLKDGKWDGFLLGRELRQKDPHGTLIYITNYGNLAYCTFQYHLEAFDYIVKEPEQLGESLGRCLEEIQSRQISKGKRPPKVYTVRFGGTLRHIPLDEILFFETGAKPHHVLLHTVSSRIDFLGSLNEIEAELDGKFFRTHRAYLVALDKIEEIDVKHNKLRIGGLECLISRTAKSKLVKHFSSAI